MAQLTVGVVAADREVWSGQASMIIARTTEGEIGILPGHTPMLAVLADGVVTIRPAEGGELHAAVYGGFLSVSEDAVSVLGEEAELAEEIDADEARAELEIAQAEGDPAAISRARARVAAGTR